MKKITLLFALLITCFANAQWTADTAANTLVASTITDDSQSIGTSDGRTYTVFWKQVAAPTNFELRAQLLDANGNQMFGPEGMLISNTIPMSTSTVFGKITIDGKNNLYVGVTGTGAGTPGIAYKISTAGVMLWGANGINLGAGYLPTILPLANDEVMISWWPGSGKGKLQRYTSNGSPIWAAPIDILPVAAHSTKSTITADMYEMSNGDVTVLFNTKLSFSPASLMFAQKYNTLGEAQWAAPTQLADKGTAYNTFYSGAQDGDVIYYGYSLTTSSRYDSFVQRLNADGTTPWGINGIDFDTNITYYEMDTKIAFEEGSQYVWAISRYTPSSQGIVGEYVQKFDKATGARQFTNNAKQVFAIDDTYRTHVSNLYLLNDQPLFLIKSGIDTGVSPIPLSAVFLDGNGDFILENDVMPVATFAANKGRITLNKPVNNQAVVTFNEEKVTGERKIYAQNFTTAIICNVTVVALPDVTTECAVVLADLTVPALTDSCGNTVTPTTDAVFPITAQGTTTITWTYTELSGDVVTQTQNIVINDVTAPVLQLQNITVALDEEGTTALIATQFDSGSTDACGADTSSWTWTVAPESFSCADLGEQTVTITATDANGNTSTATATVTVTDPNNYCDTASVTDFNNKGFMVYPNPASDVIYIRPASGSTVNAVNVYSVIGQKLYSVTDKNTTEEFSISLSNFQTGTYMISIETNNGTYTKHVVKK